MAPRIVIIGGGSNQWAPSLLNDLANTRSLAEAEIVLEDVNPKPLPRMVEYAEHLARLRKLAWKVTSTTDQRASLEGADFVVVAISTGGFDSMRHDVEIPARHGIRLSVGDAGPAGVSRTLRNVPVMVGIARDMEEICPEAWLLNLTNCMTQLVRAITRETAVKTVGLCHEVTICRFYLSMWLGESFLDLEPTVVGVNHLPIMTELAVGDARDGLDRLRALIDGPRAALDAPLPFAMPEDLGHGPKPNADGEWTKSDLLAVNQVKIELFERFGVLPASNDRHLCEYFPGFLTEESGWGDRWNVHLTTIAEREAHEAQYAANLDARLATDEVSSMPSGEMVAPLIDSIIRDKQRTFPLNLPNAGQAVGIPNGVVVETMCVADGDGVRGGVPAAVPGLLGEYVRRMTSVHELTVDAALSGKRDDVIAAMLADPVASRIDYDDMVRMTDELLVATKPWLPQFASAAGSRAPKRSGGQRSARSWLGAVALATIVAWATRSSDARVPTKAAFYLVFFTIPGVLLAVVMIRRRVVLLTVAALAGAWSVWFSWATMRSSRHLAGFGILVTPMVAFVIVVIGFFVDRIFRRR